MADDRLLIDLADAVLDGRPLDWTSATSAVSDSQRALLPHFRSVAAIASYGLTASVRAGLAQTVPGPLPDVTSLRPVTWGPLTILSPIGHGSFGDVYLAHDARLDRPVALKLLRQHDDDQGDDTAVIDEGRLMARVRHPNVVTVYGAERIDGRVGLWMEFVAGRTLEDELRERGPLPPAEVTRLGIDLCRALAAIHRAGLLHRDLKAQNVLRGNDGRILVADFGAGRELRDMRDEDTGLAGTPLYLAPEVLEGAPATTRSDIYSLGVLLFHLLTGSYPVHERTLAGVREAHRQQRFVGLKDVRPEVDGPLVDAIAHATAPAPSARCPTAEAFEAALEAQAEADAAAPSATRQGRAAWLGLAAGLALVTVFALAFTWKWPTTRASMPLTQRDSVLVTAFDNESGDRSLDGAVEYALEAELANSPFLNVAPRARAEDALRLMGRPLDSRIDVATGREICLRDGGIRALVAGRIKKVGASYLLTATLVDPSSGQSVATVTEQATGPEDLGRGLRRLSNAVRERFGEGRAQIRATAERLEQVTTPSIEALRLYSESYALGDRGDWPAALELARRAVDLDPEFPAARIWLAWALSNTGHPREEYETEAAAAVRLAGRATDWERDWIVGSNHSLRGEWERAAGAYLTLLRRRPDHRWALWNLQHAHVRLGRPPAQLLPQILPAADAAPTSAALTWNAIEALRLAGDLDRAAPYAARFRELVARPEAGEPAVRVAWTLLLPAHQAWARGDASATRALLDAASQGPRVDTLPAAVRDEIRVQVVPFYLSIGRAQDARAVANGIRDTEARHVWLALTFLAGNDRARLEAELAPLTAEGRTTWPYRWSAMFGWLLVNANRPHDAARVAATIDRDVAALLGQIAVTTGDLRGGTASIQAHLANHDLGGATLYRAVTILADGLQQLGKTDAAIEVLRTALAERTTPGFLNDGVFWMPLAVTLIELDERLGRGDEVRELRADLERRLAVAEPDFPLLVRLHSRQPHGPDGR